MSWLTIAEAAKRVERGESTIRRWIGLGLPLTAGRINVGKLLDFEREMRQSRGRPRKVEPGAAVLAEVAAERARQDAKWGEQNHPDGTGGDVCVMQDVNARWNHRAQFIASCAKTATDLLAKAGRVSWRDILLEEVFEALAEDDPATLRAELVQVAAVATQWVEAIDRRVS